MTRITNEGENVKYLGRTAMTQVSTNVPQKRIDPTQCCITQYGFGRP